MLYNHQTKVHFATLQMSTFKTGGFYYTKHLEALQAFYLKSKVIGARQMLQIASGNGNSFPSLSYYGDYDIWHFANLKTRISTIN